MQHKSRRRPAESVGRLHYKKQIDGFKPNVDLSKCGGCVRINLHNILNVTPESSNLEFPHVTLRVLFITNRELGQHPTRPRGIQHAGILSTLLLLLLLHLEEAHKNKRAQALHNVHCSSKLSPHWYYFNYFWPKQTSNRPRGGERSGCVPICALKVKKNTFRAGKDATMPMGLGL